MILYYDRISVKEGIDTNIDLLMKLFQKNVMAVMQFYIIEEILTIRNRPVINVTKSY